MVKSAAVDCVAVSQRLSDRSYLVVMSARDRLVDVGDRCKLLVGESWMDHPEYIRAVKEYDAIMDFCVPEWREVRRLARVRHRAILREVR